MNAGGIWKSLVGGTSRTRAGVGLIIVKIDSPGDRSKTLNFDRHTYYPIKMQIRDSQAEQTDQYGLRNSTPTEGGNRFMESIQIPQTNESIHILAGGVDSKYDSGKCSSA